MKNLLLPMEEAVQHLQDHPDAKAVVEDYTMIYDAKKEEIVFYYQSPSAADVWGPNPATHLPVYLFFSEFTIVDSKGE